MKLLSGTQAICGAWWNLFILFFFPNSFFFYFFLIDWNYFYLRFTSSCCLCFSVWRSWCISTCFQSTRCWQNLQYSISLGGWNTFGNVLALFFWVSFCFFVCLFVTLPVSQAAFTCLHCLGWRQVVPHVSNSWGCSPRINVRKQNFTQITVNSKTFHI